MMNAIVRVPSELVSLNAPASPPPPPRGPRGRSFGAVYTDIMLRAEEMLPDQVVHVSDLKMTPEGLIQMPGGVEMSVNDHARKMLSSMLGIRWSAWFGQATGTERAEEVNRRFARTPGEKKIRAWKNPNGDSGGIIRAVLAPSFTPIDTARIFTRMYQMMRGLMEEYVFTDVTFTEATDHIAAVHAEGMDLKGDILHPGWKLRNSEVGASALTLDDYWLRLVCTNGLMLKVGDKRALYRTHRAIDDDQLAAAFVIAIGRLPERWRIAFDLLHAAKMSTVPHPDAAVAAVLDSPEVPKALLEEAQRLVLRDGDSSRYGVVQAMTYVAHAKNPDPDVRFAIERLAGDYLAATPVLVAA